MIDVKHLGKTYGRFRALNDVSFHVEKGEVVGFLGPNGAGKTTTMRILTGYMPSSEGQARVAGFDVFQNSLEVRKRIGYLPESVPLYAEMSVRAYLDYMASLHRVGDRRQAVKRAMERCYIADRADSLIGKLSKGLRQRVGLAQAIVHDPEVLILDEPTIGLDPRQITEVRDLIKTLGQEHTVILSTHILPEVSQTCDRVLIINNGQLVAEGAPGDLTAQLETGGRIQIRIGNAEIDAAAILSTIPDVTNVNTRGNGIYELDCSASVDRRADVARAVVAQGWDLLELQSVHLSLEDVFLKLTMEENEMAAEIEEGPDA
ncbi:MAG: ATP-binding cassette domain-containing protein [Anaerolineae bacterium]|nr:ATP-binding cassette domain-containing protein [Anaerolineae bacterium]